MRHAPTPPSLLPNLPPAGRDDRHPALPRWPCPGASPSRAKRHTPKGTKRTPIAPAWPKCAFFRSSLEKAAIQPGPRQFIFPCGSRNGETGSEQRLETGGGGPVFLHRGSLHENGALVPESHAPTCRPRAIQRSPITLGCLTSGAGPCGSRARASDRIAATGSRRGPVNVGFPRTTKARNDSCACHPSKRDAG